MERSATHWWHTGMRANTRAFTGLLQGRVLDIGCGPGQELAELPSGAWGVGADLYFPPGALQTSRSRLARADAGQLPFAEGVFDWVLALDVLEQRLVVPGQALSEARRVLRPGGRLVIRVPAHPWLYGPHDVFWGGGKRFRRSELTALLTEAGFSIRRVSYANTLLFLPAVAARLLGRTTGVGSDDMRPMPGPINRGLLAALMLEARWLARYNLPYGLSLLCLAERAR
jgi:SAM-dependent methyltransferase